MYLMQRTTKDSDLKLRVEAEFKDELERRAYDSGRTLSDYCRRLMKNAIESGVAA